MPFDDIYLEYYQRCFLFAKSYLQDEMLSKDIASEAMITLWTTMRTEEVKNVRSFLMTVVKNQALNHLRNEQRKQEKLLHMTIEKDSSPTLTTELEDKEREYNQLYQALHKLPEQCKQVFTLCCLQDMKYQEAADYLGISINTVRTQMGRAYKILRNSLDSKSFLNLLFLRFLK